MSKKTEKLTPAEKLAKAERLKELGKKRYAECDRLIKEVVQEVGDGNPIPGTMPPVMIVDRFKHDDVVFQPAAARRYEVKRAKASAG